MEIPETKRVVISDTTPVLPGNWEPYFLWLQPTTGKWYRWVSSSWVLTTAPLIAVPPEISDVNFTGSVSADGDEGLTGQRTMAGYTLTFKKGLLVGFQAP